jgi:hypothetical protein
MDQGLVRIRCLELAQEFLELRRAHDPAKGYGVDTVVSTAATFEQYVMMGSPSASAEASKES